MRAISCSVCADCTADVLYGFVFLDSCSFSNLGVRLLAHCLVLYLAINKTLQALNWPLMCGGFPHYQLSHYVCALQLPMCHNVCHVIKYL